LIRTLEILRIDFKTPIEIKTVIEEIFLYMDLRDQNYRWGDCHCDTCKKGKLREKLEAMGFNIVFLKGKNDKY